MLSKNSTFTNNALRQSTMQNEGTLNISKLLKIPVLLDCDEMEKLFQNIEDVCGQFYFFKVHGINPTNESCLSRADFLEIYSSYCLDLKTGNIPDMKRYQSLFSVIATGDIDVLYRIMINDNSEMVKAIKPCIQMQHHTMQFSKENLQFYPMIFGGSNICWGLHFTYAQLFQDPVNKDITSTLQNDLFPNTSFFRVMQKWIRHNTVPTPFVVEGKKINSPIRLGKTCFAWINQHPQLQKLNILVKT